MRGVSHEVVLGQLEAVLLAAAGLVDRAQRLVDRLVGIQAAEVGSAAADRARLGGGRLLLAGREVRLVVASHRGSSARVRRDYPIGDNPSARALDLRTCFDALPATAVLTLTTLLVMAAPALAAIGHDGGEGTWARRTTRS